MELLERFDGAAETPGGRGASGRPSRDKRTMESRTHCAYNQTRECFLGLEVKAADLPSTRVGELMSARACGWRPSAAFPRRQYRRHST
jgi:hypothetical protein